MKRRSNGEGSFKKLPSGNWAGQIMVGYNSEGKRKIKTFTAPTKSEVQQKIRCYLADLEAGNITLRDTAFSDWADTWYADHKTEVEDSTYWSYSFTLKTLKDYFKSTRICDIKQLDINRFVDSLIEKGLSKSTISKCKSMLFQIFAFAEDNDLITKNPVVRSKKAKKAKGSRDSASSKKGAFSPDEIEVLKISLPNTLLGNSIMTLIGTGMRVQELLALTASDIAPDGSLISINKAVKMAYRVPSLGNPKSEKSNRTVPVANEYRPYVKYIRDHGGARFIWTSARENGLYTPEEFRNRYNAVLRRIPGVTYYPPHCCRHTYITMLQAKNVPMDLIRILAGHDEISTTVGYTHTTLDTLKKAIDATDKAST